MEIKSKVYQWLLQVYGLNHYWKEGGQILMGVRMGYWVRVIETHASHSMASFVAGTTCGDIWVL